MALKGIRVLEFAGLAPVPFCGMILKDFGATVIRIDKVDFSPDVDCLANGKLSVAIDIKQKEGVKLIKELSKTADVLIEPFRAGVMENSGLGPNDLLKENDKLIYMRLTGYGQTGPMSKTAGHDINFIAISGLLSLLGGKSESPIPPVNLAADFGGGGLTSALGILLALFERSKSGKGQVVDCSMVSGSAYLSSWIYRSKFKLPIWEKPRGYNILDGGSHFYSTYETKDGKWMAVGSIEPQFYSQLLSGLDLIEMEVNQYENNHDIIANKFKQKTQNEWTKIFTDKDACVTPILTPLESKQHPQMIALEAYTNGINDEWAPSPAPKLSRTPGKSSVVESSPVVGQHTKQIVTELGYTDDEIKKLIDMGVLKISKSKL